MLENVGLSQAYVNQTVIDLEFAFLIGKVFCEAKTSQHFDDLLCFPPHLEAILRTSLS
jgi:hypothetical protein